MSLDIWSAVASEARHRFGTWRTAPEEPKRRRRCALGALRLVAPVLARERDFLLIRPCQSIHSNRTKRQAYDNA